VKNRQKQIFIFVIFVNFENALDFLIDLTGNLLTVSLGMCQILTDEDFIIVIVIVYFTVVLSFC